MEKDYEVGAGYDPSTESIQASLSNLGEGSLPETSLPESILFPDHRVFRFELAGREVVVETGKYAKQANASVLVRYGETVVLVTVTAAKEPREGVDFFPLTVDYEERQYAVGRIPGNWFRREGRPTEKAILAARLTDRPLRPLFPEGFRNDVQIVVTVLSVDFDNAPELCGILGASLALSISDIPFNGPVGAVIIGKIGDEFILNPTSKQEEESELHLVVAGTSDAVLMVEAGADQVPEPVVLDAISFAHEKIKEIVAFQNAIVSEIGKPKREVKLFEVDPDLDARVREWVLEKVKAAIRLPDKQEREAAVEEISSQVLEEFSKDVEPEKVLERQKQVDYAFKKILKEQVRRMIIDEGIRPDGRRPDEIRPIYCEVGLLPRAHGSALFTRGQTQVLTVATLGSLSDMKVLDSLEDEEFKRYMHHYNFPPYSTGEVRPLRGPGRREIGHGALAERALERVTPSEEEFPYTIRLVSEVLESNGSTSMASVCASTLALMDTGVPIKAPVAGVAMGLVKEGDKFVVLTDIQGIEDALGDMDFKVAGTEKGITALQMDIKIAGVTREILAEALEQARKGRMFILSKMLQVLPEPRRKLSKYAPVITVIEIDPDKIRNVIGPGGKTINRIIGETNAKIDIEDNGKVYVAAPDAESGAKALKMIQDLTRDVVTGGIYEGKVVRIMPFGAFVEVLPGKEGLVHISQLAEGRVGRVEDVVNVGDEVLVKVMEIDAYGRINLSRREALKEIAQKGGVEAQRSHNGNQGLKKVDFKHKPPERRKDRR